MAGRQVISKQRVAEHGEVYTHAREVKAMLDLVAQELNESMHDSWSRLAAPEISWWKSWRANWPW